MPKDYQLVSGFLGWNTKADKTNLDPRFLVKGSQNVLIDDQRKVVTRGGYTIDGATSTATTPIISAFDWKTAFGGERNLRSYDDELEFRNIDSVSAVTWEKLLDGWTAATKFQFTTWWSTSQDIEVLLFVANNSNVYEWSGGLTTYASSTTVTITKEGTTTWAEEGFFTGASFSGGSTTREIRIKDSGGTWRTFAYTGGESTTTLTGVTPDPTAFTFTAGAIAVQAVRTYSNEPASSLSNDLIATLNNHVYVAQLDRNEVYVSQNDDFTDYSFSSPRTQGEGALLVLDSPIVGLKPFRGNMAVFAGKNDIYLTRFTLIDSSGLKETAEVQKLKTGSQQGAQSQDMIEAMGDSVVYVSNEPVLRALTSVSENDVPRLINLSDDIKPTFDSEDFDNSHIKFHKNRLYIATPTNDNFYILQFLDNPDGTQTRFWQPPQILPVRQLAIIGSDLYGHSSGSANTYRLFNDTNDNGNSFKSKAAFAYRSFGPRFVKKTLTGWAVEGYIAANTVITHRFNYEFDGSLKQIEKLIEGDDDGILFEFEQSASLGDQSLGDSSLSGDISDETDTKDKFRIIHHIQPEPFFEIQEIYETDDVDQQWAILATGPNVEASTHLPNEIKR